MWKEAGIALAGAALIAAALSANAQLPLLGAGPGIKAVAGTEFITTYTAGTARHDLTTQVGYKIAIGGSSVIVTHLGRWVISGNSKTHLLSITANGICNVPLASVTVDTAGAPAGAFLYGALASPFTMNASTTYGIISEEALNQDDWYDDNGTFSVTAVGTITSVFGAACTANTVNKGYVPPNFKYSSP